MTFLLWNCPTCSEQVRSETEPNGGLRKLICPCGFSVVVDDEKWTFSPEAVQYLLSLRVPMRCADHERDDCFQCFWDAIGPGHLGGNPLTQAIFDVLAPLHSDDRRSPIFEWGKETTPSPQEVWNLAKKIAEAIKAISLPSADQLADMEEDGFPITGNPKHFKKAS